MENHFGVYGVILSEDKQQILVVGKERGPYHGFYDLPGGAPKQNESQAEALAREILEETQGIIIWSSTDWNSFEILVTKDSAGNPVQFRHTGIWKYLKLENINLGERNFEDVSDVKWKFVSELLEKGNVSAPLKHVLNIIVKTFSR